MQASSEFKKIAEVANAKLVTARVERAVADGEVSEAAAKMAAAGYRMSAESVAALKAYLEGYGLLLAGGVGTGKTMFFKVLDDAGLRNGMPPIERFSLLEASAYKLDAIVGAFDNAHDREVVIDDIGAEPTYSNYGCKVDLLPWVIERRMRSQCRTHFTTNLSAPDIERRYGGRVVDRMHEICRGYHFDGQSLRFTRAFKVASGWTDSDWVRHPD